MKGSPSLNKNKHNGCNAASSEVTISNSHENYTRNGYSSCFEESIIIIIIIIIIVADIRGQFH